MPRSFTDQLGREVLLQDMPQRIVSVVPSQTELLYDLGLGERVVGITKFCVHPEEWFRNKTRIGGTKNLHLDQIRELRPDLIIANKEENTQEQIDALAAEYPVWISDIQTLPEALQMMQSVGQLTGTTERAQAIIDHIVQGMNNLPRTLPRRVAYMIWYNPWMSVGGDTFISHMLRSIGWENVLAGETRYPEITLEALRRHHPEIVLLSSEPFPFKDQHIAEVQAALPRAKVLLVDGEMCSWYGSRMLYAPAYFRKLLESASFRP